MNSETLAQLLLLDESDTLDFKLQHYELGQSGDTKDARNIKRAKFAKDILSFANLWRDEPRFIVIGFKRKRDGSTESPGVSVHVEGADLVKALEGFVSPFPRFHYHQVAHNSLQFGVIEIYPQRSIGPFFAARDVGGSDQGGERLLRKDVLYCRRDSCNVEASTEEQRAIWSWFPRYSLKSTSSEPEQWLPEIQLNIESAELRLTLSSQRGGTFNWALASSALERWPTKLGNEKELDRPELDMILAIIKSESRSAQMILGEPGSGKSALLAKLIQNLQKEHITYLGIKADTLDPDMKSFEDLVPNFQGLTLIEEIKAQADKQLFVILVDQLDALCSLVDRKPNRLTIIFDFLHRVGQFMNVHIVASCRAFEYEIDHRLQTLKAARVDLLLPSWEQVAAILVSEGRSIEDIQLESREVLRVPWNLMLFLKLPSASGSLTSFQDLATAVWDRATYPDSARYLELVERLAQKVDETENFWQPEAFADAYVQEKQHLLKEGILLKRQDASAFGFRHQTFYDYFLLRIFERQGTSLDAYVSSHDQSFFIRPTVLRALAYLRQTNLNEYERQLRKLLEPKRLRLHLYELVLQFVGHQEVPKPIEQAILLPQLESEEEGVRFLRTVVGSRGWFQVLLDSSFVTKWMPLTTRSSAVACVLRGAIVHCEDDVIFLMREHWMGNPAFDNAVLWVLSAARDWNQPALSFFNEYSGRLDFDRIGWAFQQLVRQAPEKAAPILGYQFRRFFEQVNFKAQSSPEDAAQFLTKIKGLLEDDIFHHSRIESVALKDPERLVNELWETVNSCLEILKQPGPVDDSAYRSGSLDFDIHSQSRESILKTVKLALVTLAQTRPKSFLRWVKDNQDSQLIAAHRLIISALANVSVEYADAAIEYLLGDIRRFYLGDFQDETRDTKLILEKLGANCSDDLFTKLTAHIVSIPERLFESFQIGMPAEDAGDLQRQLRRDRIALLSVLPRDRMESGVQGVLDSDISTLGIRLQPLMRPRGGFVGPPTTSAEIADMDEADILRLVEQYSDSVDRNPHPDPNHVARSGGVIEQARALAKYACEHPEKGKSILEKLLAGRHEKYAAEILLMWSDPRSASGISQPRIPTVISSGEIENFILTLNQKGFASTDFRNLVVQALQNICHHQNGLKPESLEMLKIWLSLTPAISVEKEQPDPPEATRSILFTSHTWILTGGLRASIIETIILGGLGQEQPLITETVEFLEGQIQTETSASVWAQVLVHLPWLFGPCGSQMTEMVDLLFERDPMILNYPSTAYFLGHAVGKASDDIGKKWLLKLYNSDSGYLRQLAGELVFLLYAKRQYQWTCDLIKLGIAGQTSPEFFTGLTYASAELIAERRLGSLIQAILSRALDSGLESLQDAASSFLMHVNEESWYSCSKTLVLKMLDMPQVNRRSLDLLIHQMGRVSFEYPEDALFVGEWVVERLIEEGDISSRPLVFSGITNIALASQRHDLIRERGLTLFEKMLALDIYEARKAADLLNQRSG